MTLKLKQIPCPHDFSSDRKPVIWIIVHTAEGSRTVESLGAYFNGAVEASSHAGADPKQLAQFVQYDKVAWTARSANQYADQIEVCGFAAWTRAEWLAQWGMLENLCQWIADRCHARGIPPVKITAADVAARRPGVIGHVDVTNGLKDGTHQDPGPNFPWDVVMARVQTLMNDDDEEDPLAGYTLDQVAAAVWERVIVGDKTKAFEAIQNLTAVQADQGVKQVGYGRRVELTQDAVGKLAVGAVDYDLLATKVADKLAARLVS